RICGPGAAAAISSVPCPSTTIASTCACGARNGPPCTCPGPCFASWCVPLRPMYKGRRRVSGKRGDGSSGSQPREWLMSKGRLEAFSDGVFAIIITIMVLDLKAPRAAEPDALLPLVPAFLSYVLSFTFVGIYWNNHHHLLQAAGRVSGGVLWANLHLLFWLSLTPFVT